MVASIFKASDGTAGCLVYCVVRGRVITTRLAALEPPLTSYRPNWLTYISWKEIVCRRDPLTVSVNVVRSFLRFCCPATRDCLSYGHTTNDLCLTAPHRIIDFAQKTKIFYAEIPCSRDPSVTTLI